MKRFILSIFLSALTVVPALAQSFTLPSGYQQIYSLNIPAQPNYGSNQVVYSVDNSSAQIGVVESLGYYVQLDDQWVWVSMNAFTSNLTKIGVPTLSSGAVWQTKVSGMQYVSNVASVGSSNASTAGNIEFWPYDYQKGNAASVPNANDGNYDFGDSNSGTGNYGSMQIHDYGNSKVLFAFNQWGRTGSGTTADLGIGPSSSDNPDWTFTNNASSYSTRTLNIYAKPVEFAAESGSEQAKVIAQETAGMNLVYKMDVPTGALSANNYLIDNAATVASTLKGMPLNVAYYLEMTKADGSVDYVYTSMDGLTNNAAKTGLPFQSLANQWSFQKNVSNMTVQSNVAGVVNGTGIQTGNVEIWNTNYAQGADGKYNYSDVKNPTGNYGSFQIHNSGAQQTVLAINNWTGSPDVGIGNAPNPQDGGVDWTFDSRKGNASNRNQYDSVQLYVMAKAAIAPMMTNVADGADYSVVQGHKITASMSTNLHTNGTSYDIVDNVAQMQNDGIIFDRIGYYMEYAETVDSPLQYVFVSMDAFTDDISKIGVPDAKSGIFYQQRVSNMSVTSNVEGVVNGTGINGSLEFWPSNYNQTTTNVHPGGSSALYDTNDSGANTSAGHGSMQIHNLDANQTVFAYNHFNGIKEYGIGNSPGTEATDWTFNQSGKDYAIANIYTFVRESDAVLYTTSSSGLDFYQRDANGMADVTLSGTFKVSSGVNLTAIQASEDGSNWIDLSYNLETGEFSTTVSASAGWHQYQFRAMSGDTVLTSSTGDRIGVGDIFITAGQSNSTNYGDAPTASVTGNVVAMNHETGEWGYANDPMPTKINGQSDGSNRGSTWPSMGDALSEMTGVPVAFSCVGWGGTSIAWWDPDADTENNVGQGFDRLETAIQNLDGNFAGILWHQGESNYGTSKEVYQEALEELILASREVAGWEVPWEVALVSWRPADGIDQNIRDAQAAVADEMDGVFLGPDSDALLDLLRGQNSGNGIHFSVLGLQTLGELWAWEVGRDILGVPEPSAWILFLGTLGGLGLIQFRKKRAVLH